MTAAVAGASSTGRPPLLFSRAPRLWDTTGDGVLHLHLHAGQARAWLAGQRYIAMLAGTQGGKTSFGPLWLQREMLRAGPGDYLAVTSTYPLLQLKMLPEFLLLFRDVLGWGEWRASERAFHLAPAVCESLWRSSQQTRVIFGSARNAESLESATAKAAWLDEVGQDQFRLESWEAISRRLSLYQGRVLFTTTIYNLGWLKHEIYDPWQEGNQEIAVIQFSSTANPAFPRAEFEAAQARLPRWKFLMFYQGRYAQPAGLVYGDFIDRYQEYGGHLVKPFPLAPHWPRDVGIDFGGVNTATVWTAYNGERDTYYLYRESLEGGITTREHARRALESAAREGVEVRGWYGGSKSEGQQRRDWEDGKVPVQPPVVADVEAQIDRVVGLFRTSRLLVFDSCRGVRDELGSFSRRMDERGDPTDRLQDEPRYHRLAALRYLVQGIEQPRPAASGRDLSLRDLRRAWGRQDRTTVWRR